MIKIQIPESGKFKFVLVRQKNNYFIFGDFLPYHSDLFDKFLQLNPGDFEVQGGGKVEIEEGKIKVFGKSDNYGPFDRKIVKQLMEKYCRERGLKLEIK